MSDNKPMISDEAVEAAAKAMSALGEADNGESEWSDFARLALEAAAPYIRASALEDVAEKWHHESTIAHALRARAKTERTTTNPHRSQA